MQLYNTISETAAESSDGSISYEQVQRIEYLDWCINECMRVLPPILRYVFKLWGAQQV